MCKTNTATTYATCVKQFEEFSGICVSDLSRKIESWRLSLETSKAPATVQLRIRGLKSCLFPNIPGGYVANHKGKDPLTKEELKKLYYWLTHGDDKMFRFSLILRFMIQTGMRKSEVIGLKWKDLRPSGDRHYRVTVIGKGNRTRTISVGNGIVLAIKDILWGNKETQYDFVLRGVAGLRLSPGRVNQLFNLSSARSDKEAETTSYINQAKELGLIPRGKYITPHSTRVTAIHLLERAGIGRLSIEEFVGHSISVADKAYSYREGSDMIIADVLDSAFQE